MMLFLGQNIWNFLQHLGLLELGNILISKLMTLMLFIIPIVIDIHGHRFEIFTLVSEIHGNKNLILGIKNIFGLEGIINSKESCIGFLNRSVSFFLKEKSY